MLKYITIIIIILFFTNQTKGLSINIDIFMTFCHLILLFFQLYDILELKREICRICRVINKIRFAVYM